MDQFQESEAQEGPRSEYTQYAIQTSVSILILKTNYNRPCPAVVVKRSKASYLIDVLGMLKVEGSNPGHPEMFIFVSECRDKSATSPSDGIDHEVDT